MNLCKGNNMGTKDVFNLFAPIVFNGVFIYIFQNSLSRKIERLNEKQHIRDEVIKRFWNKLQDLNDAFIQSNINVMRNPDTLTESLNNLYQILLNLIQYYDTNEFDLKIFSELFEDVTNKWTNFQNAYKNAIGINLSEEIQNDLGNKLQQVKEANQKLINEVRKKY